MFVNRSRPALVLLPHPGTVAVELLSRGGRAAAGVAPRAERGQREKGGGESGVQLERRCFEEIRLMKQALGTS